MSALTATARLDALAQIAELQARRVRALDTQDWDLYRTCHADDFVSHTLPGAPPTRGIEAVVSGLSDRMAGVTSIHHVHSPEITFLTPSEASGVWVLSDRLWWMHGDEEHWLRGYGHYHDTYSQRSGTWLFTSRRISRIRVERFPGATRF